MWGLLQQTCTVKMFSVLLSGHLCGFHFVSCDAGPACKVWQDSALLPFQTWLHFTPPLQTDNGRFHTRGQGPCCSSHLSCKARTLDCLRAFFNLVLIAAAMSCNHFTSPCPLLWWAWLSSGALVARAHYRQHYFIMRMQESQPLAASGLFWPFYQMYPDHSLSPMLSLSMIA